MKEVNRLTSGLVLIIAVSLLSVTANNALAQGQGSTKQELKQLNKEANKMKTFNATIDYNQYEGTLRMPTLASGSGVSGIRRFEGNFKFRFEEGRYVPMYKLE